MKDMPHGPKERETEREREREREREEKKERKQVGIHIKTRGDMITILWGNNRDIHMQMNIHNLQAEGKFCDKRGNTIKPRTEGIISVTGVKWIRWPTANSPPVAHGVGKETVFPPVRSGYSDHFSFSMQWRETFNRFSTLPSKEYAGKCWTRTTNTEATR
jgi:hypothetical protein